MIKRRGAAGTAGERGASAVADERRRPRLCSPAAACALLLCLCAGWALTGGSVARRLREADARQPRPFQTTALASPADAAGWRAWAALPRETAFAPSAALPPELPPPGGRYLLPLLITEGFGAWSDAIRETIALAARLNRTWVEPCVRNGCVEPCRCGRVRPVAAWSAGAAAAAAAAGVDPGRLPRIDEPCHFDSAPRARPRGFAADVYPLSAYVDVAALLAPGAGVSYAAWCAAYERDYAPARDAAGLWREARVYNYDLMRDGRDHAPAAVGDFLFAEQELAGGGGGELAADSAPHLFLTELVRGFIATAYTLPQLPLARWHAAAAAAFTRGGAYAAFHWRSEGVDPARFANCSAALARAAAAALPPPPAAGGGPPRALLLADMPAPGNTAKMWNDDKDHEGLLGRQWAAVSTLLAAGLVKYDAALRVAPGESSVDAGVLSTRDFLLATGADIYVTSQGDACRGCFRDESNIVRRILQVRRQAGRRSIEDWFAVRAEDLAVLEGAKVRANAANGV